MELSDSRSTASVAGTENMNEPMSNESETRCGSCAPAPCSATMETHWACACVKRGRDGKLKAIKLHPLATKSCRVCGCKQLPRKSPNEAFKQTSHAGPEKEIVFEVLEDQQPAAAPQPARPRTCSGPPSSFRSSPPKKLGRNVNIKADGTRAAGDGQP